MHPAIWRTRATSDDITPELSQRRRSLQPGQRGSDAASRPRTLDSLDELGIGP